MIPSVRVERPHKPRPCNGCGSTLDVARVAFRGRGLDVCSACWGRATVYRQDVLRRGADAVEDR